jgi:hypothetical protein
VNHPQYITIDSVEYVRKDSLVSPSAGPVKIVVLDRGFVYVGRVDPQVEGDMLVIRNARNIRVWGTTRGLGELALEGPKPDTKLDAVGTVRAPMRAVISVIDAEQSKWTGI